jgi:CHASE2 domain-containing sensor protein
MRFQLIKESLVATILTLSITYAISFIPLSLEYGKALHQGFADFDIYDLYYSGKHMHNVKRDPDIILIETGADRSEIADQINLLNTYNPKVIGVDIFFDKPSDSAGDLKLNRALHAKSNIVFAKRFDNKAGFIPNFFCNQGSRDKCGHANFVGHEFSVIRSYSPCFEIEGEKQFAFTTYLAEMFNPESYQRLLNRNNKLELINYVGNLESFTTFTKEELMEYHLGDQLQNIINDKVVMLGFFVKDSHQKPLILEDLHFTPLNERVSGKSYPDMYGVVVHANILSMVLSGKYATLVPIFPTYLIAILITWAFNFYIISRFQKKAHPSHGKLLIIQFLGILVMLYFFLQIFNWFLIKVPLEPIMIALVLSLEMLGLYKSLALWLHKRFKYQSVFTHKRII